MSLQKIYDAELNPFWFLKVRHIFAWLFLFVAGVFIQFYLIDRRFSLNLNQKDPLINSVLGIFGIFLTIVWLIRQCNLVGVNLQYLIGKIPPRYNWRSLIILIFATVLFAKGVFRVSYYPISFINPSLIENILNEFIRNSIFTEASQSFSPVAYYLFYPFEVVISKVFFTLLFLGIILHRLSTKWGDKKAIIGILLFSLLGGYTNIIGSISFVLIYILLYLKTKSLIISIIFSVLNSLFYYGINLIWSIIIPPTTTNILAQFRSEFGIGIVLTFVSAPFVLGFIYKNWHYLNEELPYFANKHSAELKSEI